MKKEMIGALLLTPLILLAGGNPGNPLRRFTVEDTVRWTLSNVEFAYNEGLLEDVLLQFSSNYSDVNGVNFTTLSTMLTQVFEAEGFTAGDDNFLMYNAEARVNGNQAVLTASILIQPSWSNDEMDILFARDTIALIRDGDRWLITSAPHLVAGLAGLTDSGSSPGEGSYPNQRSYDEYYSTEVESTRGGNDAQ